MLENINKPNDINEIPENKLGQLARELRKFIVETVSRTGGHLASSLGAVDLTIALHRVCNFPEDKIIWDVGHQSYAHKILTGRRAVFHTLRREGGISGFSRIDESDCDSFNAGHTSTSISAGLGWVRARELSKGSNKVISVIGDGALTGGMAFEALNNAADLKTNFIIVLNDNKMSISRNIGGMANYLSNVRTSVKYNAIKTEVTSALQNIPVLGDGLVERIRMTKSSIKQLFIPGMLFENMGITYLGPIDGHNIPLMIRTFKEAARVEGPVLVHVLTEKGRGYMPARKNPERFHGISAFDIKSGEPLKKKKTSYSDIFSRTLCELAQDDEKIVAVTAAMKEGTGLDEFEKRFPERFFDVGIAEAHAVTFSAAMALGGYTPVVAIYSSFLQRAFDQIMMDICTQNQHVILAVDRAGFVGEDGKTHQGCFDLSYLSMMPNMTVMAPKDKGELEAMLKFATELNGPVALRYQRGEAKDLQLSYVPIEYGKAEVLINGDEAAILAVGASVEIAIKAAAILSERGISATVVNMRFIKPVDEELICRLSEGHRLFFTIEENVKRGGLGEAVLDAVNKNSLPVSVHMASAGDDFVPQGTIAQQRKRTGTDEVSVADRITKLIAEI